MILEIIQQPNPILRDKALPIDKVTIPVKELAINMLETMYTKNGVGLAAPQVGKSLQLIVFDETPERNSPKILINPIITKHGKKKLEGIEGCLSCRGIEMLVERFANVTVKGLDINGKKVQFKAEAFLARILQHETDHLQGVTIMDIGKPIPPELRAELQAKKETII